jgi:hypothetical protein
MGPVTLRKRACFLWAHGVDLEPRGEPQKGTDGGVFWTRDPCQTHVSRPFFGLGNRDHFWARLNNSLSGESIFELGKRAHFWACFLVSFLLVLALWFLACWHDFWTRAAALCGLLAARGFSPTRSFCSLLCATLHVHVRAQTPLQVTAYFRWVNFVTSEAPADRAVLFINLDETALAYSFAGQKGTVMCTKKHSSLQLACENVSLGDVRGNVTHIGVVTHESDVQPRLPQIILGNEHKFTLSALRAVRGQLPPNVHLWRQKSSWNSHATMRRVLTEIAKALGPLLAERYVVLVLDVASVHIHPTILALATRLHIRLLFIPASLTRLLQPLDTHVFRKYKLFLRQEWKVLRAGSPGGEVGTVEWLKMIASGIRAVFQGNKWQDAFLETGLLDRQLGLSASVLEAMGAPVLPALLEGAPTREEVSHVFPKRRKTNVMSYVCQRFARPAALAVAPCAPGVPGSVGISKRRVLPASFQLALGASGSPAGSAMAAALGAVPKRRAIPWTLRPRRD